MASVNLNVAVDYSPDYDNIMHSSELVTKEVVAIYDEVWKACSNPDLPAAERESLKGRIQQTRDSVEGNKNLIHEAMVAMVTGKTVSQTSPQFALFATLSHSVDEFNRSRLDFAEKYLDAFKPKSK